MNEAFHAVDRASWAREAEYSAFAERAGCGFSITAEADITRLMAFRNARGCKLYPLLVALMAQVVNAHIEFRYGWEDGTVGYYEVLHPLFFDLNPDGSTRCLLAEYHADIDRQLEEIARVRHAYKDAAAYQPQGQLPDNVVNISCIPWVSFSSVSFCLQYCATYLTPIITFGKYTVQDDGRIMLPVSVYCNHAVNDGYHAALLINEFQQRTMSIQ